MENEESPSPQKKGMFALSSKILVVDDMMTIRKMVVKNLTDLGFKNILECSDGHRAWEALTKAGSDIQLIISDWNMPGCTGLDLLKKVRTSDRFSELPFLILTAEAEKGQILEAVKAGVSNYMIKPLSARIFKQKLEETYEKLFADTLS